MSTSEIERLLR